MERNRRVSRRQTDAIFPHLSDRGVMHIFVRNLDIAHAEPVGFIDKRTL